MIDLSTTYLGMNLRNPLVVSASPLCEHLENIRAMEDRGASAIVLHSLFEEQLNVESADLDFYLSHGTESFAEALDYFPEMHEYRLGPDAYLEHIRHCKEAVDIPIIGSLNGVSKGGWVDFAKKIEQAGADALELNVYYIAADPDLSGEQIERMYIELIESVKNAIGIPVAVKIGPYFSSLSHIAKQMDAAGAGALVLFNRFYQPDFDLEELVVTPNLVLSNSFDLRLRLRWVAMLSGLINADMAVTGGVHTAEDALKSMMAGAKVAMMTSALLRHGISHLATVRDMMTEWMEEHEYESVRQMQGSMNQQAVGQPAAYERANYIKVLNSYAGRTPGAAT